MSSSELEELFELQLVEAGAPEWVRELRFHSVRRFRFDFAWPDRLFAVELEGGTWNFGRHNRPDGFAKDCVKYNLATMNEWRFLRFDSKMVADRTALTLTLEALEMFPPIPVRGDVIKGAGAELRDISDRLAA